MILGIDASNLRSGGGVTYLVELLRAANPIEQRFKQVVVWSGRKTLEQIEDRHWLVKSNPSLLDRNLFWRILWQRFVLSSVAKKAKCEILLVPGGSYAGDFSPVVAMSHNFLPFEHQEIIRFGFSWMTLKLLLLRWSQGRSFRRANGVIFLTQYARDNIERVLKKVIGVTKIISNGVDERFHCVPREQLAIEAYGDGRPYRILYVSTIDMYKHQWKVAEAVNRLRAMNLPVTLELIGSSYAPALQRLKQLTNEFVRYRGSVPHSELHLEYACADLCVFASSCENMPIILLESMASGLPIACSNRGPMPEMLGESAMYFDPENVDEIVSAIQKLIASPPLRAKLAHDAFERAKTFTWHSCADKTFKFLADIRAHTV